MPWGIYIALGLLGLVAVEFVGLSQSTYFAPQPKAKNRNWMVGPNDAGKTITIAVGDTISIVGEPPWDGHSGFVVYGSPDVINAIDFANFGVVGVGQIHIAFSSGDLFIYSNA